MKTGVVKWFNNAKGYGFILSDENGKDVFAHYSSIEMEGYRTLRAGQCVAFEAIDGPKGLHAMSIKILEEVTLTGVDESTETQTTEQDKQENKESDSKLSKTPKGRHGKPPYKLIKTLITN